MATLTLTDHGKNTFSLALGEMSNDTVFNFGKDLIISLQNGETLEFMYGVDVMVDDIILDDVNIMYYLNNNYIRIVV